MQRGLPLNLALKLLHKISGINDRAHAEHLDALNKAVLANDDGEAAQAKFLVGIKAVCGVKRPAKRVTAKVGAAARIYDNDAVNGELLDHHESRKEKAPKRRNDRRARGHARGAGSAPLLLVPGGGGTTGHKTERCLLYTSPSPRD
jgi:hypothetical protein